MTLDPELYGSDPAAPPPMLAATEAFPTDNVLCATYAGALAGELTAIGYSDYLIHQIQSDAADVAGSTSTLHLQYDEVA